MKLRSATVAGIIVFVIALLFAAEESEADPYIEVGSLINESDAVAGGVGYLYDNKWDFNLSFTGEGETDWGTHPGIKIMSVSRLFHPGWVYSKFFMGIGIAKLEADKDGITLVDTYNYKLMAGFKLGDRSRIYYHHYSSADINENNTGVDAITLRIDL